MVFITTRGFKVYQYEGADKIQEDGSFLRVMKATKTVAMFPTADVLMCEIADNAASRGRRIDKPGT
ncbi:hypothetical protein BH09SUM1_BH09SUM1_12500 [soil metagenome]